LGWQLIRLWAHECTRVFSDRLVDGQDVAWFSRLLVDILQSTFGVRWNDVAQQFYDAQSASSSLGADAATAAAVASAPAPADDLYSRFSDAATVADGARGNALLFADFADPTSAVRLYRQVPSDERLRNVLSQLLEDHNASVVGSGGAGRLSMAMFGAAREHVCRLARVLRQPQGHALLVGPGGSGRRSVARLAAFIADNEGMDLESGGGDWREFLKKVLMKVRWCA
jgi:dynein heavy chain